LQEGAVVLASQAQVDIIPIGLACERNWRAGSWDKLILPVPFTRVHFVLGEITKVPAGLKRDELEPYRLLCQQRLIAAQEKAESLAAKKAKPPIWPSSQQVRKSD